MKKKMSVGKIVKIIFVVLVLLAVGVFAFIKISISKLERSATITELTENHG